MKHLILVAISLSVLMGCDKFMPDVAQVVKPEVLYKRDMLVTVNGYTREGVVVAPLKDSNVIYVKAAGDLDLFATANCTGEQVKPKAWNKTTTIKSGLFGWNSKTIDLKREVEFTYVPMGLETEGSCPMQLYGFSKDGKHSWGFIDFKSAEFTLEGTMLCNSVASIFSGVEACQSRAGLIQQLKFDETVVISPDKGCELDSKMAKEFTFSIPKGLCVYRIKGKDTGKVGKLTLIGYDSVLIREE